MHLSPYVRVLNFIDDGLINLVHGVFSYHKFFKPFFLFFSLIGEKGVLFFAVAIFLLFTKKYKKQGIALFCTLFLGGILSNVILKNLIGRQRPFCDLSSSYYSTWKVLGFPYEDGYSCPSGHSTAAMGFALSMALSFKKRWTSILFIFPLFIGISRIYLLAHYPTDVMLGYATGAVAAVITNVHLRVFSYKKTKKMDL